jgi:hypothetical protein
MKCAIGGDFRISGCPLRPAVWPARLWTNGPPNGLQERSSFPGNSCIPDSQDRPAIPLEVLHSMKVDRFFSPCAARLPRWDARRLARVSGRDGATPVPERGREQSAWQVPAVACGHCRPSAERGFSQNPIGIGLGRSGLLRPPEHPGTAFHSNSIKPGTPSDSCAEPKNIRSHQP